MRRLALLAIAGVAGVALGVLRAGSTFEPAPTSQPDCPVHENVVLDPLRLVLTHQGGSLVATTSATVELDGVDAAWQTSSASEPVASCAMHAGYFGYYDRLGEVQHTSPTWSWDADERALTMRFGETPVQTTQLDPAQLRRHPLGQVGYYASAAAFQVGTRELVLDVDPCRSTTTPRYSACTSGARGTIEVVVPDDVVRHDDPTFTTLPTEVVSEDGVTTYRWTFEGPAPHIAVRADVGPGLAIPLLADAGQVSHLLPGPFWVDSYWIGLIRAASDALLLLVTAFVVAGLRRTPGREPSTARAPYRIPLGYLALLTLTMITVGATLLDVFWSALLWAVVAAAWGPRTGPARRLWTAVAVTAGAGVVWGVATDTAYFDTTWTTSGDGLVAMVVGIALGAAAFVGGVTAVAGRMGDATSLLPSPAAVTVDGRRRSLPDFRSNIRFTSLLALVLGAGVLLGYLAMFTLHGDYGVSVDRWWAYFRGVRDNVGWVALSVVALVVVGFVAEELFSRPTRERTPRRNEITAVALVLAAAAPPSAVLWAGIEIPLWLVTFCAVLLVVRRGVAEPDVHLEPARRVVLSAALADQRAATAVATLDAEVSAGTGSPNDLMVARASRAARGASPTAGFFARGGADGWRKNAMTAAWCGAAIGLLPTALFCWQAIGNLPDRLQYASVLYLAVSVLLQLLRWVGLAFALGALYTVLPTGRGVSKALVLAATWSAGALAAQLVGTWIGATPSGLWLYISLQVLLFLVAVGLSLDLVAVWRADGSWRRLGDLYGVRGMRQVVAYSGPLLIAVLGLANELRQGAGADFAQQAVAAVAAAFGGPTP